MLAQPQPFRKGWQHSEALCTLPTRRRDAQWAGGISMDPSRRTFLTGLTAGGALLALAGPRLLQAAELIQWQTWQDGLKKATAEHKGIGLLVFADWCPHCRELQPVFRDPETVRAAKSLVMIRQNADEAPPWLQQRFGQFGSYVPRLFFLHPDGTMAAEIQSGNQRFPYYYQAHQGDTLRAAMKRATALGKKA
jgi:thiol-disulfide isomerase/thioredoxin